MSEKRKTGYKRVLWLASVLLFLLATVAPMTVGAAGNPLYISVKQIFMTSSTSVEGVFRYALKPLDENNPMPSGSDAAGYSFAIAGNGSAKLGPIDYIGQGVYRYELFQVIETERPGYTYDRRMYTIAVHVGAALEIDILAFNESGEKADEIVFENGYGTLPSDPDLMVDPPIKKTVTGSPSKDSVFTFALKAHEASQPMPEGSVDGVKTLTIKGSGEADFGTWSYTKAGVYYYTAYEVNGGLKGYVYDTAVYTFTDTVEEQNGRLVVSRVVTNVQNKRVSTLTFINKYTGDETTTGPKTGDDVDSGLYVALLASGGALSVCATGYLIAGKKRKEEAGRSA